MTFDEQFGDVIKEMKAYLNKSNLRMIGFTDDLGWNFKLSIPQSKWMNQKAKTVPKMFDMEGEN